MKILFLSNYIYEPTVTSLSRNATGFGIMVNGIIKAVAQREDVYLLTRALYPPKRINNYSLLSHTIGDFIFSIRFKYLIKAVKRCIYEHGSYLVKLRSLFYSFDMGIAEKRICQVKPDVVHLHGASFSTNLYMDFMLQNKIPFALTLHGLVGLIDTYGDVHYNKYEEVMLKKCENNNIPVSVISSGIKNRIISLYNLTGKNIVVISNGVDMDVPNSINRFEVRKKYGIREDEKVIISIGNITENKNQRQAIEALALIPVEERRLLKLLIAGKDTLEGILQRRVNDLGLVNQVIFLGFLDKSDLNEIYGIADLNVFTSKNEGFGLPIIEGFLWGVPVVSFSDLDAYNDMYNPYAFQTAVDRTDLAVARAIQQALSADWNKEQIIKCGLNFSMDVMTQHYLRLYSLACERER